MVDAPETDVFSGDSGRLSTSAHAPREGRGEGGVFAEVASLTDIGRVREGNEDALAVADLTEGEAVYESGAQGRRRLGARGLLLAVADGMGGHEAGEVASRHAVERLERARAAGDGARPDADALRAEVRLASEELLRLAEGDPALRGMGTTLTAAFVRGARATVCQVGDSRCYLLRGGRLRQLTKDQTYVQFLIDNGVLTEEEAATSKYRHVVTHALGAVEKLEPAITEVELARSDCLMLCSDGLTNNAAEVELREVVRQSPTLSEACGRLVALANERGGHDNITLVVARFDGEALPEAEAEAEITTELF